MFAYNPAALTLKDQIAVFLGFESKRKTNFLAQSGLVERNPDLRARRFLWLAVVLSQLANIPGLSWSILITGFTASAVAFFVKASPKQFIWRALLLVLTFAAGALVVTSYKYFIGRDAGIALLFIFGPLKLIEARTPRDYLWAWALGLLLYVASFFENLGLGAALTLPFIIVTYIAALRLFDAPADEPEAPSLLSHVKSAFVHTLLGIPLAAMLFILFPRAAAPLWGMRDPNTARTGLSENMEPGDIANLIQSRETAFRVEFEGKKPPNSALYWRGPVLHQFDGARWTTGDLAIPGEFTAITPEQVSRESLIYTVTIERIDTRWLPVLELPIAYPTGPAIENTAFLTDAQQIGLRRAPNGATAYRVQSIARPTYPVRQNALLNIELGTGRADHNPRTRALAKQLQAQYPNPRERVMAILALFNRDQYFYTLNPPLYNQDRATSIDRFLFDGKRGFCEHYSSATTLLLRASGIPARVVTGYQGGEWQPAGYMIVRQSDAHAWVEAVIDGVWTRIDPTAAIAPNRIELGVTAALPETEAMLLTSRRWFESAQFSAMWEQMNFSYTKWVIGFDRDRQRELMRDLGLSNMNPFTAIGWMLIAILLSGGVVALGWWWTKHRSERSLDPSVQRWHTLKKRLIKAGLPIAPHDTVNATMKRAAARWPAYATAFNTFAAYYDKNRFARSTDSSQKMGDMQLAKAMNIIPSARALKQASSMV